MNKTHSLTALLVLLVTSAGGAAEPSAASPSQESNAANSNLVDKFHGGQPTSSANRLSRLSANVELVNLNSEGRAALKQMDYQIAIQKFLEALKLEPNSPRTLDNLTTAYCDYGVTLRKNPSLSLKQFLQAHFYNPRNMTTQNRVEEAIKSMGKDPNNFLDRVTLGDKAWSDADFVGATMEYAAALRLKNDSAVSLKLRDADHKLTTAEERVSHHHSESISFSKNEEARTEYGLYFADLQRRIKRAWFPPKQREVAHVVFFLKVHRGGEVSDVRINRSSGLNLFDQAALRAIENAAPLKPLPPDQCETIDVAITFEHDIVATTEEAKKIQSDLTDKTASPKSSVEEVLHRYVDPDGHYPVPVMVWIHLNRTSFQ